VQVLGEQSKQVIAIPTTAITYSLYGDSVYVVKQQTGGSGETGKGGQEDEAGTAAKKAGESGASGQEVLTVERRFVRVGEERESEVSITEGIETGDMVVTSGQLKLKPDARVVINNESPLKPLNPIPKE